MAEACNAAPGAACCALRVVYCLNLLALRWADAVPGEACFRPSLSGSSTNRARLHCSMGTSASRRDLHSLASDWAKGCRSAARVPGRLTSPQASSVPTGCCFPHRRVRIVTSPPDRRTVHHYPHCLCCSTAYCSAPHLRFRPNAQDSPSSPGQRSYRIPAPRRHCFCRSRQSAGSRRVSFLFRLRCSKHRPSQTNCHFHSHQVARRDGQSHSRHHSLRRSQRRPNEEALRCCGPLSRRCRPR